jgi:hypothetical protein
MKSPMEALAILFAAGIFAALVWPEKPKPKPKEDLLAPALKKWLDKSD